MNLFRAWSASLLTTKNITRIKFPRQSPRISPTMSMTLTIQPNPKKIRARFAAHEGREKHSNFVRQARKQNTKNFKRKNTFQISFSPFHLETQNGGGCRCAGGWVYAIRAKAPWIALCLCRSSTFVRGGTFVPLWVSLSLGNREGTYRAS